MASAASSLRIASLLPSTTEIVGQLGLSTYLVAVTHECDVCEPSDVESLVASRQVERVTTSAINPHALDQGTIDLAVKSTLRTGLSLYGLREDRLRAAQPTVVLTQTLCSVCAPSTDEVRAVCSRLGSDLGAAAQVHSFEPSTMAEVAGSFEDVAAACGVPDRGRQLRAVFEEQLAQVATAASASSSSLSSSLSPSSSPSPSSLSSSSTGTTRKLTPRSSAAAERPSVCLIEWLDPCFDGGHWVPDMIEAAGCRNVLNASGAKSKERAWEDVAAADPDVVVVACCGFGLGRNKQDAERALRDPGHPLQGLRAVREGRIYALDGNRYFARPSPSLAAGSALLARCAFDTLDAEVVARLEALPFLPAENEAWARLDLGQDDQGAVSAAGAAGAAGAVGALDIAAAADPAAAAAAVAAMAAAAKRGEEVGEVGEVKGAAAEEKGQPGEVPDIEDLLAVGITPSSLGGHGGASAGAAGGAAGGAGDDIWAIHEAACAAGEDGYMDPVSGLFVFTALAAERRGKCCGSGCRHCPFDHSAVKPERRAQKIQQPALLVDSSATEVNGGGGGGGGQGRKVTHVLFWSGGKDSFLALRALLRTAAQQHAKKKKEDEKEKKEKEGEEEDEEQQQDAASSRPPPPRVVLLTTFDANTRMIAHQDIPIATVVRQAQHLGVDLVGVPLHGGPRHAGPAASYERRVAAGLDVVRRLLPCASAAADGGGGGLVVAFGDLHLDHIRDWRDANLPRALGVDKLYYPLWKAPYESLIADLEASGVPCRVAAVSGPASASASSAEGKGGRKAGAAGAAIQVGELFGRKLMARVAPEVDAFGAGAAAFSPKAAPGSIALSAARTARFSVLTSGLIRAERAKSAGGQFDDRATFAVLNRKLPVPDFQVTRDGQTLTLTTRLMKLVHHQQAVAGELTAGGFLPGELQLNLLVAPFSSWASGGGKDAVAEPGSSVASIVADPGNLNGTMDHGPSFAGGLDCYSKPPDCVQRYGQVIGAGLLSRQGFTVVNETNTTRFVATTGPAAAAAAAAATATTRADQEAGPLASTVWFDPPSTRVANHRVAEDLYLLVSGLDYARALGDWASVSGGPALPPRAALGVWYSRYFPYGAASYEADILSEYRGRGLPLSVGVLDVPWHTIDYGPADLPPTSNASWPWPPGTRGTSDPRSACNGWDGFTFNSTLFPDPPAFFRDVAHAEYGVKMILSVHMQNGIDHCQDQYHAMAEAVGMSPADRAANRTIACEMDNRTYAGAFFTHIAGAEPLRTAADWWWLDYPGGASRISGWDQQEPASLWWSNHLFAEYARNRGRRPVILARYGGIGAQRDGLGFSGDTFQSFGTLQFEVAMTPKASNVLFGWWSHDIGGNHNGGTTGYDKHNNTPTFGPFPGDEAPNNATGSEMLLRWIQFGVFSPILRTHCEPTCDRYVWHYPHFNAMRAAMRLRDALVPYIYTAGRAAALAPMSAGAGAEGRRGGRNGGGGGSSGGDGGGGGDGSGSPRPVTMPTSPGISLVRPLYYAWPTEEHAYGQFSDSQYMFGSDILVAPVAVPGANSSSSSSSIGGGGGSGETTATIANTDIFLPPLPAGTSGGGWRMWNGGPVGAAPGTIWKGAKWDTDGDIPAFVRPGTVIPMR
eukprot:g3082.t1